MMRRISTILLMFAALASGVLLDANAGAAPAAADDEAAPKMNGDWKLIQLGEDKVAADVKITLSVTAEGKVSGTTGVNRFFGKLAGEKTLFGPLGMTRIAGPPEARRREAAYTRALSEATDFAIKDDQLTLSAGDKPRLIFERIKPVEPK